MIVNARCPECGKFFKTQYWFNYHIWNCHPKVEKAAGKLGEVCKHKSLMRSCEICDLESQVKVLETSLAEANAEIQYLKDRMSVTCPSQMELETQRNSAREMCGKLAEALRNIKAWQDEPSLGIARASLAQFEEWEKTNGR